MDKGFAGATTRDVAARLGIGRGLIHHYLESWEDLQRAAFRAAAEAAQVETEACLASTAADERLDMLLDLLIVSKDDPHWQLLADAWDEGIRDARIAAMIADVGAWWRSKIAGLLAPAMDEPERADDAAWRLLALADGLSVSLLTTPPALPRERAVAHLREAARLETLAKTSGPA
jgi:AcrR family transcriptional regulator